MKDARTSHRRLSGLLIGAGVTSLGCLAMALGLFDRLDDFGLDLHFRRAGSIQADPRIVLIDIDDHALRAIGDWPWPRRIHAQLVGTLHELGAGAIVLDLVLAEPSPPRREHAGLGPHYDVDTELAERGDREFDPIIFDDDELTSAMVEAGNVYLAMYFRSVSPDAEVRGEDGGLEQDIRNRLVAMLEEEFGLDAPALAARLGDSEATGARAVEEHLAAAKRIAARRRARRFFAGTQSGGWPVFFESVLPGEPFDVLSLDRGDLLQAYRAEDAFRALTESSPGVSSTLAGVIPTAHDLTLPVDKFVKAARGVGFVSFEREQSRGVVRSIPLVADADGTLVFQLGLLVALDRLGIERSAIRAEDGALLLGREDAPRLVEIDSKGLTLLNWQAPRPLRRWQDSFTHIPAARVWEIAASRVAVHENERHLNLSKAELVETRHAATHTEYAEYVMLVNRRLEQGHETPDRSRDALSDAAMEELAGIDRRIEEIEADAVMWLRRAHSLWVDQEPRSDAERAQRDRIVDLYAKFGEGQLVAHIAKLNAALQRRIESLLGELRPRIEGKICLVGYTASGMADLVTSPVFDSVPGVMAHANLINMVLQDRPANRTRRGLGTLILAFVGILATLGTVRGRSLITAAAMLAMAIVLVLLGGAVFWAWTYHTPSLPAAVQVLVVWAGVTVYRQFVEERARRRFQRALAQYTSPAVAAQIARRTEVGDLSPQPARVTCYFSDLAGFTPLSERLGAERTRIVLNAYLQAMSGVLVDHRALINKFMGDGIFAFFNAPVRPCEDHAAAACACALDSLVALRNLNQTGSIAQHTEPLEARIGLSTGEAFVGDYGSDTKLDYTCIGDTVNLGSRLEAANKGFGTHILVDGATRQGAGDGLLFRSLGLIQVAGKALAVEVHELIDRVENVDAETRERATLLEQAVRHYQSCQWDRCVAHLDRCEKLSGGDPVIQRYRDAVSLNRTSPPPPDWNRTVPLPVVVA